MEDIATVVADIYRATPECERIPPPNQNPERDTADSNPSFYFFSFFPYKIGFSTGKVVGGEGVLFLETKKAREF